MKLIYKNSLILTFIKFEDSIRGEGFNNNNNTYKN